MKLEPEEGVTVFSAKEKGGGKGELLRPTCRKRKKKKPGAYRDKP